ncbi:MAG: serine--tRNA ligase [Candidatus Marinimicrobia bacterium]|jgi:seryl-tRNA synthetase|nr:serine--tRNA ligase [Candidatus Neomarinimicrobiota bacterium]MBT4715249.1 serine--tRNA ligase [Candidatus Neomarinimicrobiota bacterium]MBT4947418.1 serine--tRNA ligase [Candidatus Neomarinimicrobiota bacterium]MBT5267865.1 serine--tRNA ligase [Candidatus Neomarinimicrobiota bacterium]MBT6011773.1 serine--tRNA ligase [Candidatus Neomarinimicrobiota bacterium]
MLDIQKIREDIDTVRQGIQNKNVQIDFEAILKLDQERRDVIAEVEVLKHDRNIVSKDVATRKRNKEDASDLINKTRDIGQRIKTLDDQQREVEAQLNELLLQIPNLPHTSTPVGTDASENPVIKEWGNRFQPDFKLLTHLELGDSLGLFDFPRGTKIAGPGFPLYTGNGAKLERALINFMLDFHIDEHAYTEVLPPVVSNAKSMSTTGQLPKFEDDMYKIPQDELYLIPTAEVPVTNIHQGEIIPEENLPIRYCAYSSCFRREAGSYGKDTRGFLRLHQFNKVELVKFTHPDNSYEELEKLRRDAEDILEALGLEYRVIELVTGDLSFAAAKCYDLELWAPGEARWLEVSSCSNFEDFQARRGAIRYKPQSGGKVQLLHTLNGSGVATPRLLVALLETYQQKDGSVLLPEILAPYMGSAGLHLR